MVTERVITLPTEGEIVKSHPLFSFINIGQWGRKLYNTHTPSRTVFLATQIDHVARRNAIQIDWATWINWAGHQG